LAEASRAAPHARDRPLPGQVGAGNVILVGRARTRVGGTPLRAALSSLCRPPPSSRLRYVGLGTVAWTSTYVFRVANKVPSSRERASARPAPTHPRRRCSPAQDMTYAKQLRDYENAVIQKRFEELDNDEVSALMDEIYTDGSRKPTQADGSTPPA